MKLIDTETKMKLYNAYLLPHLYYCCVVWHHCGQLNLKKLEKIDERKVLFVCYDNTVIIRNGLIVWDNQVTAYSCSFQISYSYLELDT